MQNMFIIIGKSSSGKDTILKKLLHSKKKLNIKGYVPYTTRPKRSNEKNGKDYFFIQNSEFDRLIKDGKMLEYREYNINGSIWKYGTVNDSQLKTSQDIILIQNLEAYISLLSSKISENINIVPIYIELNDKERLFRAINRESSQIFPNYQEVCRRFLADSNDFSEKNLEKANITKRFQNNVISTCVHEIEEYILSLKNN